MQRVFDEFVASPLPEDLEITFILPAKNHYLPRSTNLHNWKFHFQSKNSSVFNKLVRRKIGGIWRAFYFWEKIDPHTFGQNLKFCIILIGEVWPFGHLPPSGKTIRIWLHNNWKRSVYWNVVRTLWSAIEIAEFSNLYKIALCARSYWSILRKIWHKSAEFRIVFVLMFIFKWAWIMPFLH